MRPARRSRRRAATSKRCRVRQRLDLGGERAQRGVVATLDEGPDGRHRRGVLGRRLQSRARRRAPVQLVQRARGGRRAPGRDAQGARPQRDGVEHRVGGADGRLPGPERAQRPVPGRGDHGQPREGLGRRSHPPAPVRPSRATVVARLVRCDQPQLPDRGLQGVCAHDGVHPLGEHDHLAHPPAALPGGEVAAHPPVQVAARAHVEHLVVRTAEEVDPRCRGHVPGEHALAPLARRRPVGGRLAGQREQLLEALHAEVADAFEQAVQHLDRGPGVGERTVGGRSGRVEQPGQGTEPHAGRLVGREDGAGQPGRAEHRWTRPRAAVALARRAQEPGVERRVVGDEDGALQELQEGGQHGR